MEKINLETVDEIARNDIAAIVGGNSAGWQKKLISLAGESARIIWLAATQGKSTCPPEHIFKLIRLYERAKPEKKRSDADKVVLTFCIRIIAAMETASGFDRVKAAVEMEPCELAQWWAEASKNIRRRFVFSSLRDADMEIQRAIAAVSAGHASLRSTAENTPQAAIEAAYQSYRHAIQKAGLKTDKEVYSWLEDHPIDEYDLPAFETWKTYVSRGRAFYKTRKNAPRAGRSVRAPKAADDPDLLRQITKQFDKN